MAYISGEGSTAFDILEAMDNVLQSASWSRLEFKQTMYDGSNRTSYCIWEGIGDGNDKIYIQARIPDGDNRTIYLDGLAGYDPLLYYFEQPGSIQQTLFSDGEDEVDQPIFTVTGDERFYYWIYANTYRIVGVARMSIVYESFHMGFLNPVASERQYPYPMYVCGNGSAKGGLWPFNRTGSFVFPINNNFSKILVYVITKTSLFYSALTNSKMYIVCLVESSLVQVISVKQFLFSLR